MSEYDNYFKAAGHLVNAAAAAFRKDPIEAARHAADALLEVYPAEVVRQVINDAEVRRANEEYFKAETEKVGPE